jgi:hypothetical protein
MIAGSTGKGKGRKSWKGGNGETETGEGLTIRQSRAVDSRDTSGLSKVVEVESASGMALS